MLLHLFQSRDINRRSKHHKDREFLRSISMFPHSDYEKNLNPRHPQFNRLLSSHIGMRQLSNEFFSNDPISKEDVMRTLEQFHMNPDDADDEDDDRTPTVDHPAPKFP
jgi:hypothetical protein